MDNAIKTLLFVGAIIGCSVSYPESNHSCLYNRLDLMPCVYKNKRLQRAGENNQYSIHYTRLRESPSGFVECNVRPTQQQIGNITRIGTDGSMIIYSPGFYDTPPRYDPQLLVQYNINCGEDRLAFINITSLDLQGAEDCVDYDGNSRCVDYIFIDRGSFGTTEICGNQSLLELKLNVGKFKVIFRSSDRISGGAGFKMIVTCFQEMERDLPGCLRPASCYNQSVCHANNSDIIEDNSDMNDGSDRRRKKGVSLWDTFNKYSSVMRNQEDINTFAVAETQETDVRFITWLILANQHVNYTHNTIYIFNVYGDEVQRFSDVTVLQIFDTDERIITLTSRVNANRIPRFSGPSQLVIFGRNAFLQLFGIDSQVNEHENGANNNHSTCDNCTESAHEQENCTESTHEQVAVPDKAPHKDPYIHFYGSYTEEYVYYVLRGLNACNPVLRAQARDRQQILESNETTRRMLNDLRNFTITCILTTCDLRCEVNENFAPVLPETSYCQINNVTTPEKCDPFYSSYELPEHDVAILSVTVTAINCNGQRVKHTVSGDNSNG